MKGVGTSFHIILTPDHDLYAEQISLTKISVPFVLVSVIVWRLDANNDRLRAMPNNDELMEQFTIKDSSHGAAALPAEAAAGLIAQVAAPAPIVTPEPRNGGVDAVWAS